MYFVSAWFGSQTKTRFYYSLRCFMPHAVIRRFRMQCARHGWQSVTQSKAQRQPLADPLAHHITMQQQQQQQQACVQSSMTTVSHLHTIFTRHLADKRAACAHYILHVCTDARCIPSDWRSQTKSSCYRSASVKISSTAAQL